MRKHKINNKIIIGDENSPTRITFDGRVIKYSNLEHQHLSNIYWFNTILHNRNHNYDLALLSEIDNRFKGKILSYKPLKKFHAEISLLRSMGFIRQSHKGNEVILYQGEIIGEII